MLSDIDHFIIPSRVRIATEDAIRKAGRDGYELFVLWTGTIQGSGFIANHAYIPNQKSYNNEGELLIRVESPALFHLNRWLFENRQLLAAQIHAHPADAYHSDTDDTFPIVTGLGGLSIVLPEFGREGFRAQGIAGYRLDDHGWIRLP